VKYSNTVFLLIPIILQTVDVTTTALDNMIWFHKEFIKFLI